MPSHGPSTTLSVLLPLLPLTTAHIAAFGPGMYCRNGPNPATSPNYNSNTPVNPLYQLPQSEWWFQHDRSCDAYPPTSPNDTLLLPAGSSFTVELASNQAFTTLSYSGQFTSAWPDGQSHPEDWNGNTRDPTGEGCIPAAEGGYMHTQNESMAQGTAWAIAYESDVSKIKMEDLVVFSVLAHSPWKRQATYDVPADLPATCPEGGCTCAWLWVPRGCGEGNMYMQGFRCEVTRPEGGGQGRKLAKAKPPTYCAGDDGKCVKGAKQMIVFNQKEGDNTGYVHAQWELGTPAYNERNGFVSGAQEDIFEGGEVVVPGEGQGGEEVGEGEEEDEDKDEEIGECVRKIKARKLRKRGAGKWRA